MMHAAQTADEKCLSADYADCGRFLWVLPEGPTRSIIRRLRRFMEDSFGWPRRSDRICGTSRTYHPQITPIEEDSGEGPTCFRGLLNSTNNLCESVESVDRTSGFESFTAPIICVICEICGYWLSF